FFEQAVKTANRTVFISPFPVTPVTEFGPRSPLNCKAPAPQKTDYHSPTTNLNNQQAHHPSSILLASWGNLCICHRVKATENRPCVMWFWSGKFKTLDDAEFSRGSGFSESTVRRSTMASIHAARFAVRVQC